jgi:purine-nucleoside phosphorylase
MSTVFEVITAAHCGLEVLGFSLITNKAAGIIRKPLSGEEVNEIGRKSSEVLGNLIKQIVGEI